MNKITLALVLGTGLTLGLFAPSARASDIQTLATKDISSDTFNSLFQPYNTAILSPFRFDGSTADSGLIESQVFKGTGQAQGLYAYAYQVAVNPAKDGGGEPVHVDSLSFKFGGNALGADLTGAGTPAYAYVVMNDKNSSPVGGLTLTGTQVPSSLSLEPGQTTGFVRAQYVNPDGDPSTKALAAGANSATFVLLTKQLPATVTPSVNVGGGSATTTVPVAYNATTGTIEPVPVPEPATLFAWAGMAGAVALVRRVRRNRQTPA